MNWQQLCEDKRLVDLPYCGEHGRMTFFEKQGMLTKSALCPEFPAHVQTP